MLTENLLLYVFGCAAGLLAAQASLHLIVGLLPSNVPHLREIEISARILATTVAGGCAPPVCSSAWCPRSRVSAPWVIDDLADGRGHSARRVDSPHARDRADRAVTDAARRRRPTGPDVPEPSPVSPGLQRGRQADRAQFAFRDVPAGDRLPFFKRLFDGLRAVPGVQAVAGSTYLPMSGLAASSALVVAGETSIDTWTGLT